LPFLLDLSLPLLLLLLLPCLRFSLRLSLPRKPLPHLILQPLLARERCLLLLNAAEGLACKLSLFAKAGAARLCVKWRATVGVGGRCVCVCCGCRLDRLRCSLRLLRCRSQRCGSRLGHGLSLGLSMLRLNRLSRLSLNRLGLSRLGLSRLGLSRLGLGLSRLELSMLDLTLRTPHPLISPISIPPAVVSLLIPLHTRGITRRPA
jgi:hypothetical protein